MAYSDSHIVLFDKMGIHLMIVIEHDSNLRRIDVPLGETIEICLDENPTTGFRWILTSTAEPICQLIDHTFDPHAARAGVGAAGHHRWRFEAAKAGEAMIAMSYSRPWDQSSPPAKTFALQVQVK